MDSFREDQNNLRRANCAGCVTLFKTRQSHAVRFSFMPMVMKSPGLKPIEAQNARSSRGVLVDRLPVARGSRSRRWRCHERLTHGNGSAGNAVRRQADVLGRVQGPPCNVKTTAQDGVHCGGDFYLKAALRQDRTTALDRRHNQPDGQIRWLFCEWPVQLPLQKYFCSHPIQITFISRPSCPGRGALAIVTNVGAGCGGRARR